MAVLLAREPGRDRIKVAALPERGRQLVEAERDVEALGALDDVLRRRSLEQRIEAGRLDEAGPALRPAVPEPVRRDLLGRRALEARGQLVLRPAVQPVVERLRRRQRVVEQLHHLVDGHAVVGDLQREVRVVAELARHLVAQLDQLDQARLQRPADLLRHRPDALPLVEVARLLQDVVDVVGGDRLGAGVALGLQAERVAVQDLRLLGFELDALRDDLGDRARALGGGQQQLAQLADRQLVQLLLVLEQRLRLVDDGRRAADRRQRLVGAGSLGDVLGRDVGGGGPVGEAGAGRHRPTQARHRRQERVGFLLGWTALAFLPPSPPSRPSPALASGGLAVAATATAPTDRQATRTPTCRIEPRMSRPYIKSGGGSRRSAVGLVDGRGAW